MVFHLRLLKTVPVFLLLLISIVLNSDLRAQGLQPPSAPPGVASIVQPSYLGLEHFYVDSTLFESPFSRFKRSVTLDSTHQFITFSETLFGKAYRLPVRMDVSYYVAARAYLENRERMRLAVLRILGAAEQGGASGIELNIPVKIKSKTFRRIFGGDRVGLRVSGNISFELAGRTESREGSAVSSLDQRGNFSPKFKQTQQFRVEGRVGDKVTVSVDQNSEATFDFENTLKLTYDGDEDEIVQKIEAGNVNLSLPSTNYVSTTTNHQGLFGIKSEMQVGKFNFTGIASLERGQNQTLSISGSSRENTFRIKDYEFVKDRFFFIDNRYRDFFEDAIIDENRMQLGADTSIYVRQLDVWKTVTGNIDRDETFDGFAVNNPDSFSIPLDPTEIREIQGRVERGRFKRLTEGVDYEYDFQRGFIILRQQPTENEIIAVGYSFGSFDNRRPHKVGMSFQDIDSLAATDSSVTILLRMVKARASNPSYPTWSLSMRNVYNLGASGISAEGFDAKVIYSVTGEDQEVDQNSGKTYNFLLGIDRVNDQGVAVDGGDKKPDVAKQFVFDLARGYLIFPSLTPFAPTEKFQFDPARHVNIYNIKDDTRARQESKFELEVTTTAVSSTYDLGFNVLEGSETVKLNGRTLAKDRDYTIDYFSGRLEITAPEARRADAQVDIEYERGALFQLDKKSMLGGRLEYAFGEQNFIGLTSILYSRSTLDQRVRLGQEPIRNFVWDVNTALHFKPNFLTSLVDKLPIVETSAESKLRIEAEYAQVNPNPNTFNEPKLKDNDGVAYIDDFEGSKRFTSLGIQYRIWTPASVPQRFLRLPITDDGVDYGPRNGADPKEYVLAMDRNRIRFNWFNPFNQVFIRSIWPDKDVTSQSGTTTNVLTLRWENNNTPLDSAWAGIMRSTASFPDQKKTKFIELWIKGENGQINIDLGRISEDYYVKGQFPDPNRSDPNILIDSYGNLNTEDVNFNGLLDINEDVGIDGVAGADGANILNDAGDDDWGDPRTSRPQFLHINGTEGNSAQQGARFPDTEDLDGDGVLNRFNDYFEYSFDLRDPQFLVSETFFDNGTPTGWKLYRIPLKDYRFKVGNPDTTFQQVLFTRLWVNNIAPSPSRFDSIQIATFDFVGNEWEEEGIKRADENEFTVDDQKFGITVFNTEEHSGAPTNYSSPPGVEGVRDRITLAVSKEQSLVMQLRKLPPDAAVEAKKQFREKVDMIHYQRLKMFVHGDEGAERIDPERDRLFFYVRFGPTDKIYYEYRQPLYPGWDERNEMIIDFPELARTKDFPYDPAVERVPGIPQPDSLLSVFYRRDPNFPEKEFIVVGSPALHNINYIVVGAINLGNSTLLNKEIWLDELRVTGAERQSGTAMRLLTDLTLADVATFRAQWELVDDDFRRLQEQFSNNSGRDRTQEKQSYFASMRLNKFLPESWGLEIPIDGKLTRSRDVPKYFYTSDKRTNYDLSSFSDRLKTFFGAGDLPAELDDQVTFSETKSVGGTLRRRDRPRDPWYLRFTVNQMTLDVDYSERTAHNPTAEFDNSTSLSSRFAYQVPYGRNHAFRPFSWLGKGKLINFISSQKFYYLPTATSVAVTLNDNESVRKNRLEAQAPDPTIKVKTTRKLTVAYKMTDDLTFDFNRDYQSDAFLKGYRTRDVLNAIVSRFDFGEDTRISQRFGMGYTPNLFSWLTPNYRYTADFIYSLDDPRIEARSSNLNVNQTLHFDFKLATLLGQIYSPKTQKSPPKTSPRKPGGPKGGQKPSDTKGGDVDEGDVRDKGGDQSGKGEDKGEDQGKEQKKRAKASFQAPNPLKMMWGFLTSFKNISLDFKRQNSFANFNLERVPVWKYQFGFQSDPEAGTDLTFDKIFLEPSIRKSRGVDGSVRLDLLTNLQASLTYNQQKVESSNSQQRTASKSNTVFFSGDDPDADHQPWWDYIPDWRVNLSGVEKLPLFKSFAKTATLEHVRNGKFTESSRFRNEESSRDQWSYNLNYQPFIGLTVNTIWNVSGNVRSNKSTSFDYRSAGGVTRRDQSGFNVSLSYSVTKGFRLPLPFLNKKRLNNEIQFSLTFDRTNSATFTRNVADAAFEEQDVSNSWKLRPTITYRFSQKVNGTAFYEQSSSFNKRTGTTTAKEFGINVNIAIR